MLKFDFWRKFAVFDALVLFMHERSTAHHVAATIDKGQALKTCCHLGSIVCGWKATGRES